MALQLKISAQGSTISVWAENPADSPHGMVIRGIRVYHKFASGTGGWGFHQMDSTYWPGSGGVVLKEDMKTDINGKRTVWATAVYYEIDKAVTSNTVTDV